MRNSLRTMTRRAGPRAGVVLATAVALAAFVGASTALANAANPNPDITGTATQNSDGRDGERERDVALAGAELRRALRRGLGGRLVGHQHQPDAEPQLQPDQRHRGQSPRHDHDRDHLAGRLDPDTSQGRSWTAAAAQHVLPRALQDNRSA